MRVLGVDYGARRVGLALSDESGAVALPYAVKSNTARLVSDVAVICQHEGVARIVVGESLDLRGGPNPIQREIESFAAALRAAARLPVDFEPEHFTSAAAARAPDGRPVAADRELDARAAALILQSYLDRHARLS